MDLLRAGKEIGMKYIKELRDGEMVKEIYLCKQLQILKTKAGKSYYSMMLQDKTGTLSAKVWDLGVGIDHFEAMDYIQVDGQVISFQGALQMNIRRVRRSHEGEYDPADFMPATDKDIDAMYSELLSYISKVKNAHLKKLLDAFYVENTTFIAAFKKHSAAKSVHHGFMGGLLEHTLSVTRMCNFAADNYPLLQKDLLMAAAMFHDIGKIKEISEFPENDYTDAGNLLGHIYIGAEWIGEAAAKIPGFPNKILLELKHCILAHHGELEYGSPKKPAIAEALAIFMIDNFDAKLQTIKELIDSSDEKADWLGFQRLFDTNIRRTSEY